MTDNEKRPEGTEEEIRKENEAPEMNKAPDEGKKGKSRDKDNKEKDKKISRLEAELSKAEKEIEKRDETLIEAQNKLNRMLLEFDNYKKRTQREKEAAHDDAVCEVMNALLPVLDTLESAAGMEADPELAKGINMTLNSFRSVLTQYHVEAIGEVGEAFDPDLHNAVAHIENEELGESVIAAVFRKGYRMGTKVIRPAMVQVAN